MRGEYGLRALEHFANVVGIADAAQPLDGIDDQNDFSVGRDALAPHILHRLDREIPRLLDQLLDDAAGLFLQLLLEGRVLLQGGLKFNPAGRNLDFAKLDIRVQKRPYPLEKAGLSGVFV